MMSTPRKFEAAGTGSDRPQQTGLVTLLFTDMVGSTALKHELGDRAAAELFRKHHEAIRETLKAFPQGEEIETAGDSFLITFATPSDAVAFALLTQARLRRLRDGGGLSDRMGIHVGEVMVAHDSQSRKPRDLFGIQIDTCSRVMSLAKAGQTLMTRAVFDSARQVLKGEDIQEVGPLEWLNHGAYLLQGLEEAVEICEVQETGQRTSGPPTSSGKAQRKVSADEEPVLGWRPAVSQAVPNTRWILEKKLGEGGFGEVWLGRNSTTKQLRVFKFCFQAERVRFLKRELTLFRLLKERVGDHPHIVAIHDVYLDQAPFYVEMEYVEGADLRSWCQEHGGVGALPLETRLEIVAQAAEGLQAAQEAGIIHRDIKPANILIAECRVPNAGCLGGQSLIPNPKSQIQVKLTDFGIGQVESAESLQGITRAGFTQTILSDSSSSQTGTQLYMAPELLSGKPASTRSDIYSLGVVLYQLLVADFTQPVTGDWAAEIQDLLIREDLQHCLAGKPQDRFAGADQLAKHLRALPERRAELAERAAEKAALARAAYRRGIMRTAAVAAVIVVVIGALAILALSQSRRARAEAAKAAQSAREATESRERARRLLFDADMNLAQQSMKQNNLGQVRRLLDRHRPQAGEEDLRGWEWRYLWQQSRSSALLTLTNRPVRGFDVSFSPNGGLLAVGWFDGRVGLWDVAGRRFIRSLSEGNNRSHGHVTFSPVGNLLAATASSNTVALYHLETGRQSTLWRPPNPDSWDVRDLSFSQDGSRVVIYAGSSRAAGDAVWVINVASGEIEIHVPTPWSDTPHHGAARLSPDNRRLYFGRSDAANYQYSLGCIEVATGQEIWHTPWQRDYGLCALAIAPDGGILVSASGFEDPTIRIWDAKTGRSLGRLDAHTGWVAKLVFTQDGRQLISAAVDQTIRVWDTGNWTETQVLRGHSDELGAVAVSDQARLIASAGKDGNLMLWRKDGQRRADGYSLLPPEFNQGSISQALGPSHRLWLLPGKRPVLVDPNGNGSTEVLPELAPPARVLGCFESNVVCYWNGTNKIISAELRGTNLVARGAIELKDGAGPAAFTCNPRQQLFAWMQANPPSAVYIANLKTSGRPTELKIDLTSAGVLLLFSTNGEYLAAGSSAGVRVWQVESGRKVLSFDEPAGQGRLVVGGLFAAGGRTFVADISGAGSHEICFFDLRHPDRPPRSYPGKDRSRTVTASPDGRLVAATTYGGLVLLFDADKRELIEAIHGHLNATFGIAFSPDGKRLISAGGGREAIKLWDVNTRQELLTLPGRGSFLARAAWSWDGQDIVAGIPWQVWHTPTWEEIAAAEAKEPREPRQP